jgi:uncharacterized protein (TIGR02246 family)
MHFRGLFSFLAVATLVVVLATAAQLQSQKSSAHKPAQSSKPASAGDREGIAALQKNEIRATMAMDVNSLLDLWTDDAVLLPPRHEPVVGKAALRKFLQDRKEQYVNYDLLAYNEEWNEVMVTGDYAYQWGTVSYRMKPPTGSEIAGAAHAVRVLKHEEDAWRVLRAIWNEGPRGQ